MGGGERALFAAKEKLFPMKRHHGKVEFTFPKTFCTQNISANGTKLDVRVGGRGRQSCCCTATARPATCGCHSQKIWSAITGWSSPISAVWGSPLGQLAATTRKRKARTQREFSMS